MINVLDIDLDFFVAITAENNNKKEEISYLEV
jgi:hypothetical protein